MVPNMISLNRKKPVTFAASRCLHIAALVILGAISGCSNPTVIKQASAVAEVGIAYADTLPSLYDESFELAVRADSLVLEQQRTPLPKSNRQEALKIHDKLLEQRLALLRDLKHHALLLRSYFVSLRSLAQVDVAPGITDAAGNVVDRLADLRTKLEGKTLGTDSIKKAMGPVVKIAVAKFQGDALRKELQAHAGVIERELALQSAAVKVIGAQMTADKDLEIQMKVRNPVFLAYVEDRPLQPDWADRRLTVFRQTVALSTLEDAMRAADNLHQSWIAFAEGALDDGGLNQLVRDLQAFVGLVDAHKAATTGAK